MGDVQTYVTYWKQPEDGSGPDSGDWKQLIVGHKHQGDRRDIVAHDVRGNESTYSLDKHGFEIHKLPTKERDHLNQEEVQKEYYQEIIDLIKKQTGGKDVTCFGNIVRQYKRDALTPEEFIPGQVQGPSPRVHVDVSPIDPERLVGNMMPGKLDAMTKGSRWQFFSIWRPTKSVSRDPLAYADSGSVPNSDYCDIVGPKYNGTILKCGDKREHRWHYCSNMTPDEVVIVKHLDSKRDIPAWRCPHTSIPLPGTEDLPARESIEVRALVLFD
ncbi:uncharacterized protein LY89DRAFT_654661 [Mollisia scopiformis]|uniref:Uncharacterized protein n=1 Tax=Mollisia scopiformis TaxID=149040 RepID=A0A194WTT1_MOLSC|nr:uncharacterized protein LY89DRAFT_654661 [Mollisia scopiformis]KUJ11017.1 hypothetical protein LY89DRAFT_654661 [Mollisia scopiformis]